MKKILKTVLAAAALALTASFLCVNAFADDTNKPDVSDDGYYLVGNADQLDWVAQAFNQGVDSNMWIRLTDDIVYNESVEDTTQSSTWRQFTPLGNDEGIFIGIIDGQGYTIKGLYVKGQKKAGLVSYNHGTIKNLGIIDSYIYASGNDSYAGAFAGSFKEGSIENCFCVNTLIGSANYTGGLVGNISGSSNETANIESCYIAKCKYRNSQISKVDTVGNHVQGAYTIQNCYWGLANNARMTTALLSDTLYPISSEDQLAHGELCYKLNGSVNPSEEYPAVWRQNLNLDGVEADPYPVLNKSHYGVYFDDGIYTNRRDDPSIYNPGGEIQSEVTMNAEGYYEILTVDHLFQFAEIVNSDYTKKNAKAKLLNDIVIYPEKIVNEENFYRSWMPIGNAVSPFVGEFDGQGFTISGLYGASADYELPASGFFGCIDSGAQIKNVVVINSYFYAGTDKAGQSAGAIVGIVKGGTIENCLSRDNTIVSEAYAGSLTGQITGSSKIKDCFCVNDSVKGSLKYGVGEVTGAFNESASGSQSYSIAENCYYYNISGERNKKWDSIKELLPGDVNVNDSVEVMDAVSAMYWIYTVNPNDIVYYAADFDGDGEISRKDVTLILRSASGLETKSNYN